MLSNVLEVSGLILLSVAAFMVSAAFGIALAGASCIVLGIALDRKGDA